MDPVATWGIRQGRLLQQGCNIATGSLLQLLLCGSCSLGFLRFCFSHCFVLIRLLWQDACPLPACSGLLLAALQHLHHTTTQLRTNAYPGLQFPASQISYMVVHVGEPELIANPPRRCMVPAQCMIATEQPCTYQFSIHVPLINAKDRRTSMHAPT